MQKKKPFFIGLHDSVFTICEDFRPTPHHIDSKKKNVQKIIIPACSNNT